MIEITYSEEQTEALGQKISADLRPGDFLGLYGSLGSGKTVFARGICRGLGNTIDVSSPTFNIINFYPGKIEVAHVDLYRVDSGLDELGLDELFESDRIIIVEWAEKVKNDLPPRRLDIFFNIVDLKTREVRIEKIDGTGN